MFWTSNTTVYNIKILQRITIPLFSIIALLGIIGNGLVIWIAGFRMKKTMSSMWFLNLAIADFLCCASIPLRIADWATVFSYSHWHYFIFCLPNVILFTFNMSASVFLLVAMSIDRCVSVMWPFWAKTHRTCKCGRIIVAIIWGLSVLLTISLFLFFGISENELCLYFSYSENDAPIPMVFLIFPLIRLFMMFVIPFLIILISYVIIFIKLKKSKRPPRSQRPYRIITAVILCFFICWSPYYIWPLTPMHYFQFHIVNTFIIILAYLNSCLNPIIYVFMGQDFKLSFFRSIPDRVERALNENPNDQCREREDCEQTHTADV